MKTLLEVKINNCYKIVKVNKQLPVPVYKRLTELGITPGNNIALLIKNKIAKSGIVRIWGSMISLDYYILSNIEVE